jgi:Pyridine nucleotide-disulphide oxidoreductase
MTGATPHVIIVGGGFGGTNAAHALRYMPVRVTVIDRTNHSVFFPLLYQVATCGLSAHEISVAIRFLLRPQPNAEVMMAEVTGLDLQARAVCIGNRQLHNDYLILASGSQYNYFGHDDWPRLARSVKSVADAARVRHRILHAADAVCRIFCLVTLVDGQHCVPGRLLEPSSGLVNLDLGLPDISAVCRNSNARERDPAAGQGPHGAGPRRCCANHASHAAKWVPR